MCGVDEKDRIMQPEFKLSALYIAQIKQRYGVIGRENYNKQKSEDRGRRNVKKRLSQKHCGILG